MATRKEDIAALLDRSTKELAEIKGEYNKSLQAQKVSAELRIDIKNLCENLRSILDYLAQEIRVKYCPLANQKERFYFPILPNHDTFELQISKWFPNLKSSCPDLWIYLESLQPYHNNYVWLSHFNRVNIENKHNNLIEQTRTELKEIRVTSQDGSRVSWNPESVKFGQGVYICGVSIDPQTQLPIPHPTQKIEHITWVDFRFEGIDVSALQLLKTALEGVKEISAKILAWL